MVFSGAECRISCFKGKRRDDLRYLRPVALARRTVEIDNNLVENAIRPNAIGKKNWLFIGHPKAGQRSAIIYTMVENCRVHGIAPLPYLADVMPRLVDREEGADVGDLLPRQWKAAPSAG